MLLTASSAAIVANAGGLEPAPVKLGFFELVPILGISEQYDSNLYRQAENEQDVWIQVTELDLKAQAFDGPHQYSIGYQGEAGFVASSSDDNYVDHAATLEGKWDAGIRHRFELLGSYRKDHDRRGTAYFQGNQAQLIDEPARFDEELFRGRYSYGALKARGRIDVELQGLQKTYTNFRELTELNDYSQIYGTTTFLWRLGGSLYGLVETTYGEIDYDTDPIEQEGIIDIRDSTYANYLTGVTWELAGKTTGTLKVGHATKDFGDKDRDDFSGTSWSGEVSWNPRTYSTLILSTGRRTDEATDRSNYIDVTDWGIAWTHKWGEQIKSRLRFRQSDETYEADDVTRDDTVYRYGLDIDYTVRRWLVIGVFYTRDQRESNLAEYDYPRDFAGLTLRASL